MKNNNIDRPIWFTAYFGYTWEECNLQEDEEEDKGISNEAKH